VQGGQLRLAERQDGHILKTPGTAIRSTRDRGNSGVSGTSDNPVNQVSQELPELAGNASPPLNTGLPFGLNASAR
jgi:hypothetical protein